MLQNQLKIKVEHMGFEFWKIDWDGYKYNCIYRKAILSQHAQYM